MLICPHQASSRIIRRRAMTASAKGGLGLAGCDGMPGNSLLITRRI